MGSVKEPIFKINPNFRLTTKYLSVRWHCVDSATLECEATIELPDHYVSTSNKGYKVKLGDFITLQKRE